MSSSDNVNCASLEESYSLSLSDVDSLLTSSSNTADEHSLDSLKFEVGICYQLSVFCSNLPKTIQKNPFQLKVFLLSFD